MDNIKTWFNSLSQRERKLVFAASIVAIIGIFYFAIWSPLHNAIALQKESVQKDSELLVWTQEQANRATFLRQSSNSNSFTGSLTQLVNQTTRSARIPVSRLQPQGDDLLVYIDEVEFNQYINWLANLEQRGVVIVVSDVSETDAQGFIQVRRLQLGKS